MANKAIIYLLITLFFWWKTLRKPEYGLAFFAAIFFIRPETIAYRQLQFLHIPLMTGLFTFTGWYINKHKIAAPTQTALTSLLGLFCLLAFVSTYFSEVFPLWRWPQEYLNILIFCFLLVKTITNENKLAYFVFAMLIGSFFLSLWGVDQYFRGNYRLEGLGGRRFGSNEIGAIIASTLPFFIFKASGSTLFFTTPLKKRVEQVFFIIAAPVVLSTVTFTQSRGAFIGLISGIGILFFRSQKKIISILLLTLTLPLTILFLPEEYTVRMATIFNPAIYNQEKGFVEEANPDGAITSRLAFWRYAAQMAKDHPFLGVGPQNFELLTSQYSDGQFGTKDTHNTYLKIGAELGIPALALFFTILLISFRNFNSSYKLLKNNPNTALLGHIKSTEAAFVSLSVSGITSSYNYTEPLYWYIFLSASLLHISKTHASRKALPPLS